MLLPLVMEYPHMTQLTATAPIEPKLIIIIFRADFARVIQP